MACAQPPVSGTVTVATRGSTTPVLFPLPMKVENSGFTGFFTRFEVLSRTDNLEVEAYIQVSDDGRAWTDVSGSGFVDTEGWTWLALIASSTTYRYMRPCARARTKSGESTIDAGVVRLTVSFRS